MIDILEIVKEGGAIVLAAITLLILFQAMKMNYKMQQHYNEQFTNHLTENTKILSRVANALKQVEKRIDRWYNKENGSNE